MTPIAWTTLVSPEALQPRLGDDDLVLLDCRGSLADPSAGLAAWRASHLPGARHADMERDLSGPHVAGAGRHPWPDAAAFIAKLSTWGISADTQVVAYDDGDGAYAARLWFLLHALGHARVAVLDGGWRQWCAQGRPVDGLEPEPRATSYRAAFDDTLLVDARGVSAHLDAGGLLLDARAAERFRGDIEPIDRVAGHVPGAVNRPYAANLVEGGFKPSRVLHAEFEALLEGRGPADVVAMCGSGVTACHHLLAMAHAGLPGARLFTGSWSGWIEDPARPVATGAK